MTREARPSLPGSSEATSPPARSRTGARGRVDARRILHAECPLSRPDRRAADRGGEAHRQRRCHRPHRAEAIGSGRSGPGECRNLARICERPHAPRPDPHPGRTGPAGRCGGRSPLAPPGRRASPLDSARGVAGGDRAESRGESRRGDDGRGRRLPRRPELGCRVGVAAKGRRVRRGHRTEADARDRDDAGRVGLDRIGRHRRGRTDAAPPPGLEPSCPLQHGRMALRARGVGQAPPLDPPGRDAGGAGPPGVALRPAPSLPRRHRRVGRRLGADRPEPCRLSPPGRTPSRRLAGRPRHVSPTG